MRTYVGRVERCTKLLCITVSSLLVLAGCRNAGDRARSEAALRFQTTDEVLQQAEDIMRKTLDDPRTLQEYDSLLELGPAYLDPRFGVAADYAAWHDYRVEYEAATDSINDLQRLGLERRAAADPLETPAILEGWARQVETAGSPTELIARALEAADIPCPEFVSASAEGDAMDAIDAAAREAHRILDREMLGALGPEERALLSFLVRYITVSGGTYQPVAFDAPRYYWGAWGDYSPEWCFEPGAERTPLGVEVPEGLPSFTSIYHFFRSLTGDDLVTQGLAYPPAETAWAGQHAVFTNNRVDLSAAARAFAAVAPVLEPAFLKRLERESRHATPSPVSGVEGEVLLHRETEYGDLIIGGPGANRYTAVQAAVIIDVGGNDVYEMEYDLDRLGRYPLRIVIDLHGDDVYSHRQAVGPGAGVFGLGILLDQEGNDLYAQGVDPARGRVRQALLSSDSLGPGIRWVDPARLYGGEPPASLDGGFSFGAALFGIGLHLDRGGNDTYLVDKWALGAAFAPGFGVLADEGGDDWYIAAIQSVGTGFNKGVGILRDVGAGADRYQSWGVYRSAYTYREANDSSDGGYEGFGIGAGSGWRSEIGTFFRTDRTAPTNYAAFVGGIGLVSDGGGDDVYVGSTFGLAEGYTAGIGMLVDGSGDDVYVAMQGGQHITGFAEGEHHGTGFLLDRTGNDFYSGSFAGTGEDLGLGYFIDIAGDDHYTDLWKIRFRPAASPMRSLGLFLDGGGQDTFPSLPTFDWANASEFYPKGTYHADIGGNFSFVLLLGPEQDQLPPALAETMRGPVTLTSVSYGEEEDGKEYVRGIGIVLIEAAGRNPR
jgi:hypothetical protein